MTQEEKDLLLKDLCARLPYGVKVKFRVNEVIEIREKFIYNVDGEYSYITDGKSYLTLDIIKILSNNYLDEIKPYLFPLSSMTEEQCEELRNLIYEHFTLDDEFNEGIRFKTYGDILVWLDEKPINQCYFIFDWLNKNHFDYRGLIPMGSAIDATGLNIY